jgi:hypothetical protein
MLSFLVLFDMTDLFNLLFLLVRDCSDPDSSCAVFKFSITLTARFGIKLLLVFCVPYILVLFIELFSHVFSRTVEVCVASFCLTKTVCTPISSNVGFSGIFSSNFTLKPWTMAIYWLISFFRKFIVSRY